MKLVWDETGHKIYETGTRQGVLYPLSARGAYGPGVAWNGLTAVSENPSGAEANDLWADDAKYLSLLSAEQYGATIEAYTYPPEFEECDGTKELAPGITIGQQSRKIFGFSFRTTIGNDIQNGDYGYKLHLIYGGKASPSAKNYSTTNDSPEAVSFSWEVSTAPVNVRGFKPTATLVIDSTKVNATKLAVLEDILYGTATTAPRLPLPNEVMDILTDGVTSLSITTAPTKTAYSVGDTFDPAGMVVTATRSDTTSEVITSYGIDPEGPLASGTTKVVISYAGKTVEQTITVTA